MLHTFIRDIADTAYSAGQDIIAGAYIVWIYANPFDGRLW